jgi:sugar phosphate permease
MVALTATLGTLGNVLATAPLTALLSGAGWATSFVIAASASAVWAVAVLVLVDDRTPRPRTVQRGEVSAGMITVARRVRAAWSIGGTRLGFWAHFSSMAAATPLAVLWGHPYLVEGVGFSTAGASRLLMVGVLVIGIATPVIGAVTGRWPVARIPLSLSVCAVTMVLLTVVSLGLPADPGKPIVAIVFVIALLGGPASMTAFAVARDYNPARTLGTASGVVNVGGFVATVVATVAFGAVLDVQGGSSAQAMRHALLVLVGVQLFGSWRLGTWYRRVRGEVRRRQEAGEEVPVRVGRQLWFDVRELEGPAVESVG